MNNREIVENFIAEKKKHNMKFLFIQLALDFIEVAIAVPIMMKLLDDDIKLLIFVIVFAAVLTATIFFHIKIHFGSFKYFSREASVISDYNVAEQELKNAQKANDKGKATGAELAAAQRKFDEAIDEIAKKVMAMQN